MNDEFETLPFAAGALEADFAGELEEERTMPMARTGGRGGMRGRPAYRGGGRAGARTLPQGRPQQGRPQQGRQRPGRWPRGPYWGPFYGGYPYGVMVGEPVGYPVPVRAEPAFEPIDLPGQDGAPEEEEIPAEILDAIRTLRLTERPDYKYVGSLQRAPELLENKPGYYLITFQKGGKEKRWHAYSGQTDELRRRLGEHRAEANRLGFTAPRHKVYTADSALAEPHRRNVEWKIHDWLITNHRGVLTNPQRELEFEVLGWSQGAMP